MGAELLRLLLVHPRVTLTGVTSERLAGEPLGSVYPHLRGLTDLVFHDLDAEWLAGACDVAFLALPHMESQKMVPVLRKRGRKVIDLSADYRLHDAADYTTWYKTAHVRVGAAGHAARHRLAPERLPGVLRRRVVRPGPGRGRAADDARRGGLQLLRPHGRGRPPHRPRRVRVGARQPREGRLGQRRAKPQRPLRLDRKSTRLNSS